MNTFTRKLTSRRGFSLIEVMIALTLTGIIIVGIMKLYVVQHQNYIVQDDVSTIQQNARASIDELTRQIRMAGYDLPQGIDPVVASNTNPDTITITYCADGCDTYLASAMPQPSSELKCATDVSCFEDGQWVYIFHPDSGGGEWFEITAVQAAAKHLQHNTMVLSQKYDADAIIIALNQAKFFVDNTTDPSHPSLMVQMPGRTPQLYAENISDLQFRYRLTNGNIVDVPVLVDDVCEILISVTGRSSHVDYENPENGYRIRTYRSSVNLRNI